MNRFFLSIAASCAVLFTLTSCYTEPNPLASVATIGGPVAIVRSMGFLNTTRVLGSDIISTLPEAPLGATSTLRLPNYAPLASPTPGGTATIVVEYTTLEVPATAVNLYVVSGTTRTLATSVTINVAPSQNRVRQTFTYSVPMTAASGSRIALLGSVVTANGESWSGTGVVSATGVPSAGTAVINVR
jgi:hypothetical protein